MYMYTCSSLVCSVDMYPMAPPRNRKIIKNGKFLVNFQIVATKFLFLANTAEAALDDGGVGGKELRTPQIVRKKPGRDGRNQTRLSIGMAAGLCTRKGVSVCPRTRPRGLDIPRIKVAMPRSESPNQFWLILVGTQEMKGHPMPVRA